jgi:dethiobiotin synthetase
VVALKPVETGFGRGDSDAERLASALYVPVMPPLYAFEPAISPHLAAARVGVSIEVGAIVDWVLAKESLYDTTSHVMHISIVETAGGVLSPLSPSKTNLDLARALEPALWLLVAPDALGVLHDLRATLLALDHVGRRPDHVILSAARGVDESTGSNAAELAALGIAEPIAVFGPSGVEGLDRLVERLLG